MIREANFNSSSYFSLLKGNYGEALLNRPAHSNPNQFGIWYPPHQIQKYG